MPSKLLRGNAERGSEVLKKVFEFALLLDSKKTWNEANCIFLITRTTPQNKTAALRGEYKRRSEIRPFKKPNFHTAALGCVCRYACVGLITEAGYDTVCEQPTIPASCPKSKVALEHILKMFVALGASLLIVSAPQTLFVATRNEAKPSSHISNLAMAIEARCHDRIVDMQMSVFCPV